MLTKEEMEKINSAVKLAMQIEAMEKKLDRLKWSFTAVELTEYSRRVTRRG